MEDELVLNGLNGGTGRYFVPPIAEGTVGRVARDEDAEATGLPPPGPALTGLTGLTGLAAAAGEDFDRTNVGEAGWAVVFADDAAPSTIEALAPLVEHRRRQATAVDVRFRVFSGPDGHRAGETAARFLRRHGVDPGEGLDPAQVPYYVLIVGDPKRIPFRFQYLLDVERAVGRLHFDTDGEYARYAESVVAAETAGPGSLAPRTAAFFATRNADDVATRLSADLLVGPLAQEMEARFPEWTIRTALAADATKARLTRLVGRDEKPALLFTAGHGLFFDKDHPDQARHQGALVSQDWPGPVQFGERPLPAEFFFAADDVADDADVRGMVAFFFACFGLGTPLTDDFAAQATDAPAPLAARPFIGKLPQRLLAHPGGGALAVVGHVDRAWPSSFNFPGTGVNIQAFSQCVAALLRSHPVGAAMEALNLRHARLTQALVNERESIQSGRAPADFALLGSLYKARNDARNYAVFGDPAVRLG